MLHVEYSQVRLDRKNLVVSFCQQLGLNMRNNHTNKKNWQRKPVKSMLQGLKTKITKLN